MKVAITGASGLVGSRFFDLFKSRYELIPISSSYGVDITDTRKIKKFLEQKKPALIIHLAAKTNVDLCESDMGEDMKLLKKNKVINGEKISFDSLDPEEWKGSETAFGVNVVGTKNLADYAKKAEIKFVYVSTDFVFDGEKEGEYSEEDPVSPANWYGQTKHWGEQVIESESLILRTSYPFGYKSNIKKDLVWTLVDLLSNHDVVKLISDQIITPTFIDDIAEGINFLIQKNELGLFHLVGNNHLSPYDIGVSIAREFEFPDSKIELTTRELLYKGRAARPFKVMLKNDKLKDLGFEVTDFFEALTKIKQSAAQL